MKDPAAGQVEKNSESPGGDDSDRGMSERERWIVYPLLFLALGTALRDKLMKQTVADQVVCKQLIIRGDETDFVVLNEKGVQANSVEATRQLRLTGQPVLNGATIPPWFRALMTARTPQPPADLPPAPPAEPTAQAKGAPEEAARPLPPEDDANPPPPAPRPSGKPATP
ncbi:MAG: hypothetical protein AAGB00_03470 [Planctomycetota bacterium]